MIARPPGCLQDEKNRLAQWTCPSQPRRRWSWCCSPSEAGRHLHISGGHGALAVVSELAAPASEVRAALSHVVVDFEAEDEELLHSGWSSPEREANSAESFAWAVGKSAELKLFLLPDPPQWLPGRAWPFAWPEAPSQHLTVLLNETKVADLDMTHGAATYAWRLPQGSVRAGWNSLRFEFSRAGVAHAVLVERHESRPLAAAFAWVEVASQIPPPFALRPRLVTSGGARRTSAGVLLQPGEAAVFPVSPNGWIQPRLQFTLVPLGLQRAAVSVWATGNQRGAATEIGLCDAKIGGQRVTSWWKRWRAKGETSSSMLRRRQLRPCPGGRSWWRPHGWCRARNLPAGQKSFRPRWLVAATS